MPAVTPTALCDEQRGEQRRIDNVPCLDIPHCPGDGRKRDDRLEVEVTFPAVPKMTDLPLIPILRPFGGNQLVTALDAGHPKFGATIG